MPSKVSLLLTLAALVILGTPPPSSAQNEDPVRSRVHLLLTASFDPTQSDQSQFDRFFGTDKAAIVEGRLLERLSSELAVRARRGGFVELEVTSQSPTAMASVTRVRPA